MAIKNWIDSHPDEVKWDNLLYTKKNLLFSPNSFRHFLPKFDFLYWRWMNFLGPSGIPAWSPPTKFSTQSKTKTQNAAPNSVTEASCVSCPSSDFIEANFFEKKFFKSSFPNFSSSRHQCGNTGVRREGGHRWFAIRTFDSQQKRRRRGNRCWSHRSHLHKASDQPTGFRDHCKILILLQ